MQVFPLIYYIDRRTAYLQLVAARRNAASGAFLISHGDHDDEVIEFAAEAKLLDPHFSIGLSLAGKTVEDSLVCASQARVNMLWMADAGIHSSGLTQKGLSLAEQAKAYPELEIYVSVAVLRFCDDQDPAKAARLAVENGYVPVTSALATTGYQREDKVSLMFAATGGRLAVVGGGSIDGVVDRAPYFHHILTASRHTAAEAGADPRKIASLIAGAAWPDAVGFV